jgi:hypothetical protein
MSRWIALSLTLGLATIACRGDPPTAAACEEPPVIRAGEGITDFRLRIEAQTAEAPADSVLEATLSFISGPNVEDRDLIAAHSGTITYDFHAQPTVTARFAAADLARYVRAEPGRLKNVSLGGRRCAAGLH